MSQIDHRIGNCSGDALYREKQKKSTWKFSNWLESVSEGDDGNSKKKKKEGDDELS